MEIFKVNNTCFRCGVAVKEVYAINEEAARAGLGLCEKCANHPPPKSKRNTEPAK